MEQGSNGAGGRFWGRNGKPGKRPPVNEYKQWVINKRSFEFLIKIMIYTHDTWDRDMSIFLHD